MEGILMDRNQVGKMLAEANIAADQVAKMNGVKGEPTKAPIIAMIIQNLHEALLAFDKGVDVTGVPISPKKIGEGLTHMLNHLRDNAHWTTLQEGLSALDVNRTVKLTGRIRATANALLNTPIASHSASSSFKSTVQRKIKPKKKLSAEEIQRQAVEGLFISTMCTLGSLFFLFVIVPSAKSNESKVALGAVSLLCLAAGITFFVAALKQKKTGKVNRWIEHFLNK